MKTRTVAVLVGASTALAAPALATKTLQMDLNALPFQALDAAGNNSAFGGLNHTGSVSISFDPADSRLEAILVQFFASGPFVDQGFTGTLTGFSGLINLVNGAVTGGNLTVTVDGGADTYTAAVMNGSGSVDQYTGGYRIDGLTFQGTFSDAMFSNVDVSDWYNAQGGNALYGDFLNFRLQPDANGAGYGDVDLYVVVPLPPATWLGLAGLAGVAGIGYIRRRR